MTQPRKPEMTGCRCLLLFRGPHLISLAKGEGPRTCPTECQYKISPQSIQELKYFRLNQSGRQLIQGDSYAL